MESRKRPKVLTIFMWYILLTTPLVLLIGVMDDGLREYYLQRIGGRYAGLLVKYNFVSTIICAMSSYAVLKWKKWGAYVLLAIFSISTSINTFISPYAFGSSLFFLALFAFLIKKYGETLNENAA